MEKREIRLSSGFSGKRVGFTASLLMLVIYVALSVPLVSNAQFECDQRCQMLLANCLQAAHGDPLASTICMDNYDSCWAACGSF